MKKNEKTNKPGNRVRKAQMAQGRALLSTGDSKAMSAEVRSLAQRVSATNGASSRVGGVIADSIENRAREEFRYVQGLVFPALSGPIPDLTTEPSSWTCLKESGTVTASATGTVRMQILPSIGDMVCTGPLGGTSAFGVAGLTGGCQQYTDAPQYRALIDGVRCTALAVELKPVASALVNQGQISVGLTPTSPSAYLSSSQISRLPSQVNKGLPELLKESLHFYMEFGAFNTAGGDWHYTDFQGKDLVHNPASPCMNIAVDGALANTPAFIVKITSGWEAVSSNRILALSTPFSSSRALEAATIVSHPVVRKLLKDKNERLAFAANAAKWIWGHRNDITGVGSEILELAGRAAGAVAPYMAAIV